MKFVWLGLLVLVLVACGSDAPKSSGNAAVPTLGVIFGSASTPNPVTTRVAGEKPTTGALFASTPAATAAQTERVAGQTPTLGAMFANDAAPRVTSAPADKSQAPTLAPVMVAPLASATARAQTTPTIAPTRAAPASPATPQANLAEVIIFDETLDANWTLENSKSFKFNLQDKTFAKNGQVAIAATPQEDFGTLLFAVKKDAAQNYPRNRVWGVSVWINPGSDDIAPEELALTIVGSNENKFWVANDTSVKTDQAHFFSETRLYYLGVNKLIPPKTWVELIVQIDKLPYDPDYQYVTGIYLKNGKGFTRTFYVDRVALLMNK